MTYDEAVAQLHQASFKDFVSERKRLAAELKSAGDKDGASRLGKAQRPSVSAWAVNQLWWQRQEALTKLFHTAERVRSGDRDASKEHRQMLADLREHAALLLREGGNAATEATLRRVTTTLSALAAAGGFAPDPPGALAVDREPPGFETAIASAVASARLEPSGAPAAVDAGPSVAARDSATAAGVVAAAADEAARLGAEAEQRRADQEAARLRADAELRRAEQEERERRQAERDRLTASLREAQALEVVWQHEVARLHGELAAAEESLNETRALIADIEKRLAE